MNLRKCTWLEIQFLLKFYGVEKEDEFKKNVIGNYHPSSESYIFVDTEDRYVYICDKYGLYPIETFMKIKKKYFEKANSIINLEQQLFQLNLDNFELSKTMTILKEMRDSEYYRQKNQWGEKDFTRYWNLESELINLEKKWHKLQWTILNIERILELE